jgi:membrane associated rhomboid family serine protease
VQSHAVLPATAEMSALVQQLLIAQGGAYVSVVNEARYKRSAVLLRLDPSERHGQRLPAGNYLVMPWDALQGNMLQLYLERLLATGAAPNFVILITSRNGPDDATLFDIGARLDVDIASIDIARNEVLGAPHLRRVLDQVFDPDAADALSWVNPLSHMTVLADPRDPGVFFERLRRASPNATLTKLLIGVNVLVFVMMKVSGGEFSFDQFPTRLLVVWGANVGGLTVGDGETWRLFTCTFLHADLLHIGFNMYALKVLGDTAERLFGTAMFGALYLLSALGGSIASLAFTLTDNPMLPSVGASGAVFGLMGGLLGFALSRRGSVPRQVFRGLTRSALFFIFINVAIGFSVTFIDNAAHLGGLAVGVVGGLVLSRELPPAKQPSPSARRMAVGGILMALTLAYFAAANELSGQIIRAGWQRF